jgi:hypothetical protein
MQRQLEIQQFEETVENWERTEHATQFEFRDLNEYPRYERQQNFPSCKLPCFHYLTDRDSVHATFTRGERIPQILNTLYDLSINQSHNQAITYDRLLLLSRYFVRTRTQLQPIPEEGVLQNQATTPSEDLKAQINLLRADLREIKASQVSLKLSLSEIREAVTELNGRESIPKPIEAETAAVAEQLKTQVREVQATLADLKAFVKSLVPEA